MGFLNTIGKALSPAYAFSSMGKGQNPANAAMPYLNQIPQVAREQLGPWGQQGQQAQQANQGQYGSMIEDPAAFYEKLRSTYSPSEGYKFREEQARKAMHGSAAAGGYATTEQGRLGEADLIRKMMQEDENAYVDRLLGIHGTGLQGNEMAATRGYGAAGDYANIAGSVLGQQGALAYRGQENENMRRQDRMKMIMQLIGTIGGGIAGGPAGAAAGSKIGGAGGGPSIAEQFHLGMGR